MAKNDISGGALDIYPPSGLSSKAQQQPVIEVEVFEQEESKANIAPQYDAFQPQYAHHSTTHGPTEMREAVLDKLGALVDAGKIDHFEISPFEFVGRTFTTNENCEFSLKIYTDSSSESVVELRRIFGECFEFAALEETLLKGLMARGVIDDEDADGDSEEVCGFGFDVPSLASMPSKRVARRVVMDEDSATQILRDAVDLASSTRDKIRADIAYLRECMDRHIGAFTRITDIVSIIAGALNGELFDCWAVKTYVDIIGKLIASGAAFRPTPLSALIEELQSRWRHTVVNQVGPGVAFEFFPSQQIVRSCEKVIKLLAVSPK